ncbi:hypothetical protein MSTO_24000 [Mycobacterium stomatepiae]|uniref:Uncharacterized protein n=1 Tax=Mycobacterium stomatepiae TaxID=470076 RepID=A0A7I7Q764_9MYCO|nr:hypothetical protein MSTO_24000 [Mycobacterium stomatepiae]
MLDVRGAKPTERDSTAYVRERRRSRKLGVGASVARSGPRTAAQHDAIDISNCDTTSLDAQLSGLGLVARARTCEFSSPLPLT